MTTSPSPTALVAAPGGTMGGLLALALVLTLAAWVAMRRPAVRRRVVERDVWDRYAQAVLYVAAGFGLELVQHLAVRHGVLPGGWAATGFTLGAACAWSVLYRGLIRWNRLRTAISDPSDWLNGISGVTALMAAGNVALSAAGSPLVQLPWWLLQGWLLQVCALAVLLGTTGTVSVLGDLVRDTRVRAITLTLGLGVAAQVAVAAVAPLQVVTLGSGPLSVLALVTAGSWVLLAATLCVAAHRPRPVGLTPRDATPEATTAGAVTVVLGSVAVLVAAGLVGQGLFTVGAVLAVVAATVAAVRLLQLVHGLADVARSRAEARTDDLTGVANRRRLVEIVTAAARDGVPVTLVAIDLDRFKDVNDRYGHAAGDALIRAVAQRLQGVVAGRGTFARLGGDEFALVMDGPRTDEAVAVAHDLLAAVREPIEVDGRFLRLGASIGVASSAFTGDEEDDVMRRADTAMYAAKRTGTGVSVYDEAAGAQARRERALVDELRGVLGAAPAEDGSGVVVHYQPQVEVTSGAVVGVEALVRWQRPGEGLLPPAVFVHLAEQHGLMAALTRRVLETAGREAVVWRARGHGARLSVNVSTSSMVDPGVLGRLDALLGRLGLPADALVLEITETTLMADPELAVALTTEVAARGIGVSIDDYGTGYSSLAYLNDLPAEELKLDRTFTGRLTRDPRTAAIVSGTVDLAHHLGLRLVVEGVEDEETLTALRALGCDVTQGYLHARPMPAEELHAWLEQHDRGRRRP